MIIVLIWCCVLGGAGAIGMAAMFLPSAVAKYFVWFLAGVVAWIAVRQPGLGWKRIIARLILVLSFLFGTTTIWFIGADDGLPDLISAASWQRWYAMPYRAVWVQMLVTVNMGGWVSYWWKKLSLKEKTTNLIRRLRHQSN